MRGSASTLPCIELAITRGEIPEDLQSAFTFACFTTEAYRSFCFLRNSANSSIDSPTGEAHGVLVGEYADLLQKKFPSSGPIYIDVSTERRYSQAGCSRLKVMIWQDGVRLSAGDAPRKQGAQFGINYCRDGLPPRSLS